MRIITGEAKGCKLSTPEGLSTRPTSERAKEAVFSIIQFAIEGRSVLDLYSGSGQMGLEALSRGAVRAVMVDNSPPAVSVIKRNAESTRMSGRCRIIQGNVLDVLDRLRGDSFDIVFIDPPYSLGIIPKTLECLCKTRLLKQTSVIICESSRPEDLFLGDAKLEQQFEIIKQNRYGAASITIMRLFKETD